MCCTVKQNKIKIINRNGKVCITCLRQVFFTCDVNVKWRSETFDEINVIIVQSAVVLNMSIVEPQNAPYTICSLEVHIVYPAYTICSPLNREHIV